MGPHVGRGGGSDKIREPFLIADPVTADASVLLVSDSLVSASLVRIEGHSARVLWTIPMPMSTIAVASPNGKLVAAGRFLPSGTFEIVLYEHEHPTRPTRARRPQVDRRHGLVECELRPGLSGAGRIKRVRCAPLRRPRSDVADSGLFLRIAGRRNRGRRLCDILFGWTARTRSVGGVQFRWYAVPSCEEIAVSSTKQGGAFRSVSSAMEATFASSWGATPRVAGSCASRLRISWRVCSPLGNGRSAR